MGQKTSQPQGSPAHGGMACLGAGHGPPGPRDAPLMAPIPPRLLQAGTSVRGCTKSPTAAIKDEDKKIKTAIPRELLYTTFQLRCSGTATPLCVTPGGPAKGLAGLCPALVNIYLPGFISYYLHGVSYFSGPTSPQRQCGGAGAWFSGKKNPVRHGHGSQERHPGGYLCGGCGVWPWGR